MGNTMKLKNVKKIPSDSYIGLEKSGRFNFTLHWNIFPLQTKAFSHILRRHNQKEHIISTPKKTEYFFSLLSQGTLDYRAKEIEIYRWRKEKREFGACLKRFKRMFKVFSSVSID